MTFVCFCACSSPQIKGPRAILITLEFITWVPGLSIWADSALLCIVPWVCHTSRQIPKVIATSCGHLCSQVLAPYPLPYQKSVSAKTEKDTKKIILLTVYQIM